LRVRQNFLERPAGCHSEPPPAGAKNLPAGRQVSAPEVPTSRRTARFFASLRITAFFNLPESAGAPPFARWGLYECILGGILFVVGTISGRFRRPCLYRRTPPMKTEDLLEQIKARLAAVHGARLRRVILYGSEARGETAAGSDIDVLVLLDGPIDYGQDLEKNLCALYPLALELGRRISAKPVSAEEYESVDCPLYRSAHLEGIAV
jgi:uncharacterized protein